MAGSKTCDLVSWPLPPWNPFLSWLLWHHTVFSPTSLAIPSQSPFLYLSKFQSPYSRQNNALPLDVHVLMPRTCVYVTCGKGDFGDVIKSKILRWEMILDYQGGPNVITRILVRGSQETQHQRWQWKQGPGSEWLNTRSQPKLMTLKIVEGAASQRMQSLETGKCKRTDLFLEPQKECSPAVPWS